MKTIAIPTWIYCIQNNINKRHPSPKTGHPQRRPAIHMGYKLISLRICSVGCRDVTQIKRRSGPTDTCSGFSMAGLLYLGGQNWKNSFGSLWKVVHFVACLSDSPTCFEKKPGVKRTSVFFFRVVQSCGRSRLFVPRPPGIFRDPQGHGTPENGKRDPYYSHTTRIFESLKIWEWYGKLTIFGGPMSLGVPGKSPLKGRPSLYTWSLWYGDKWH